MVMRAEGERVQIVLGGDHVRSWGAREVVNFKGRKKVTVLVRHSERGNGDCRGTTRPCEDKIE